MLRERIKEICERYLSLSKFQREQCVKNQTSEIMATIKDFNERIYIEDKIYELKDSGECYCIPEQLPLIIKFMTQFNYSLNTFYDEEKGLFYLEQSDELLDKVI